MPIKKKYIFILFVFIVLVLVVVKSVPILFIKHISFNELKSLKLSKDENIYVCELTTFTGPEWLFVGDSNGIFTNKSEEQVIIKGDTLPFLFRDREDDLNSKKLFVIKAKMIGEKHYTKSDQTLYKVLKPSRWYIISN